jgi:hypothetical protein
MPRNGWLNGLLVATALLALPGVTRAAQPEMLPQSTFAVQVDSSSSPPVVAVTFALALSDSPSYPVTVTALSGSTEELLWEGSLSEGVYLLRAPLTRISGSGAPLRVVVKTKVVNRNAGSANLVYLKWEGTLR